MIPHHQVHSGFRNKQTKKPFTDTSCLTALTACRCVSTQPSSSWEASACRLAARPTLAASSPCGGWCCCRCQLCCSRAPWWAASPSSGSAPYRCTSAAWRWRSSTTTRRGTAGRTRESAGSAARGGSSEVTEAPRTVRTVAARAKTNSDLPGMLSVCVCVCVLLFFLDALIQGFCYLYVCAKCICVSCADCELKKNANLSSIVKKLFRWRKTFNFFF